MDKYRKILENAKTLILSKELVQARTYENVIIPLELDGVEDNIYYLTYDKEYKKKFYENNDGTSLDIPSILSRCIEEVSGEKPFHIDFKLRNANPNFPNRQAVIINEYQEKETGLKSDMTFDKFIKSRNNEHSYEASLRITKNIGTDYNPLFIYASPGLGKTHLLNAIGNEIKNNNPTLKVWYVTSENFLNEHIESIKKNRTEDFRKKYRNLDVFLLDDVQFLSRSESAQTELFHIFESLKHANRQIVICSDKPPSMIADLEDRLVSRFNSGLPSHIDKPDLETRIAILQKYGQNTHKILNDEVIKKIATLITSNIRELEGAYNRVHSTMDLVSSVNGEITPEYAEQVIKSYMIIKEKEINLDRIKHVVADFYEIKLSEIESSSRVKELTIPRQVIMYLSRELTDSSLQQIADALKRDNHTTIKHGYDKIKDKIEKDYDFKNKIERIIMEIKGN